MSCSDTNDMITNMVTKHSSTSQETCISQMSQVILQPAMCQVSSRQCLFGKLICFFNSVFQKGLILISTYIICVYIIFLFPHYAVENWSNLCIHIFVAKDVFLILASTMFHCRDTLNTKYLCHKKGWHHEEENLYHPGLIQSTTWKKGQQCFSLCVY